MIKPSILLALFLGIIFAQMIPAHSEDSKQVDDNASDEDSSDRGKSSDEVEYESESEEEDGPALTCILFNNFGCNTECSIVASAFAINGSGECTQESTCQCNLEEDDSLEGLFRAKFKGKGSEAALEKIKKDKKLTEDVLNVLQRPFQTAEQTKKQLKNVTDPAIYDQLTINDVTPASTRHLFDGIESLNLKNIQGYVAEKLKPILKSSAKQLKDFNYVLNLKKSLNSKDLQSIVNEVRRTKNKKLSAIVDAHLKAARIRETPSTEKETLADAMGHIIIDTFVNEIEKKKNPSAKKRTRKTSPVKGKGKKKPIDEETSKKNKVSKASISNKVKTVQEDSKNGSDSSTRFQLPGFNKDSISKHVGSIDKTFQGEGYTLHYQRSNDGSLHFVWEKNSDTVDISVSSKGSVSQNWVLDDAKIQLSRDSDDSMEENWDFGTSKCWYSMSAEGHVSSGSTDSLESYKMMLKYQALIEEFCKENDFLFKNPQDCSIYEKS